VTARLLRLAASFARAEKLLKPHAARALLRREQRDLANASSVSLPTVKRLESKAGALGAHRSTVSALTNALEAAGIEFIDENGGGPGVRLRAATEKELTACSCRRGQSACFRGLRRVGVWRSLFASETQRHWRARPIFSTYATFVREVQAACIQKQSHQGGINDHQIDIFRDVPGQADHSWSGTWLDIVGEVTASKMTASEMT
jgi:hypothetical protein